MPELAPVRTVLELPDFANELAQSFSDLGEPLTREGAALLLAQIWLETARGKSCFWHNVGNITAGTKWAGDFFRLPANPRQFRAYDTPEHGVGDYALQIAKTHFRPILVAANANDPAGVASAIRTTGYTPDEPAGVAASLTQLRDSFLNGGLFPDLPKAPAAADASASPSC